MLSNLQRVNLPFEKAIGVCFVVEKAPTGGNEEDPDESEPGLTQEGSGLKPREAMGVEEEETIGKEQKQ